MVRYCKHMSRCADRIAASFAEYGSLLAMTILMKRRQLIRIIWIIISLIVGLSFILLPFLYGGGFTPSYGY